MITMPIAHYPAHGTSGSLIVVHDIDPDVPCAADAVDMARASSWAKQSHSSNVATPNSIGFSICSPFKWPLKE